MSEILKLGKMSSKELAAWFGMTYNSYKNQIPKRLKMLEDYCAFEKVFGGVVISEIYIETFTGLTIDDELFMKEIEDNYNKEHQLVYSVAAITRKFMQTYAEIYSVNGKIIDEKNIYKRLSKARKRCLPLLTKKYPDIMGAYGNSKKVWAIKVDEFKYRELTESEKVIFNQIIREYYNTDQGIEEIKELALVKDAFKRGEITAEELGEEISGDGVNFFYDVICEFSRQTDLTIVSVSEAQIKNTYKYFKNIDFNQEKPFIEGDKMVEIDK